MIIPVSVFSEYAVVSGTPAAVPGNNNGS